MQSMMAVTTGTIDLDQDCAFWGGYIDDNDINVNTSYVFPYLEKGSNYLLKEFPDEKTYQDSKEKIEEL